jgi:hypothetical protein
MEELIENICMRLAAGGAPVAVKPRAVELLKVKIPHVLKNTRHM